MANEYVHKPVNLEKVKAKRRVVLSEPGYLEANYMALRKYDGVCCVAIIALGGATLLTRTGEAIRSCGHIKAQLESSWAPMAAHTVVFGELWHPTLPFPEISGLARRYDPSPDLRFIAFDAVRLDEWEQGESREPFAFRFGRVCQMFPGSHAAHYNPGTYGDAQALCNRLVLEGGYDGLILADPSGGWVRGNGTGGEKIKVKRKLSFDLEVVGTLPGKGKHEGRIGTLLVRFKDGKVLGVGTGLSDEQRQLDDWVGKVIEVEAMDYSSDGLLREPRMKGVRYDKDEADF